MGNPDPAGQVAYHRTAGVRYFHGCYWIGDDTLWGVNREHKGTTNTLKALRSIQAAHPGAEKIYIIMDNVSAHTWKRIRHWAAKHFVELRFTPAYSSWTDPVEAYFGPLHQFTIANYPNHTVQTRKLQAYLRWRNAHPRAPEVLDAQRRERARIRSEKGHHWGRHGTSILIKHHQTNRSHHYRRQLRLRAIIEHRHEALNSKQEPGPS